MPTGSSCVSKSACLVLSAKSLSVWWRLRTRCVHIPAPHAAISMSRSTWSERRGKADDLRIAHLSSRARQTAGAARALPEPHAADLGEARYPPGRFLDDAGRREQPAADLHACLGQ